MLDFLTLPCCLQAIKLSLKCLGAIPLQKMKITDLAETSLRGLFDLLITKMISILRGGPFLRGNGRYTVWGASIQHKRGATTVKRAGAADSEFMSDMEIAQRLESRAIFGRAYFRQRYLRDIAGIERYRVAGAAPMMGESLEWLLLCEKFCIF